jgi:hypothetical protein
LENNITIRLDSGCLLLGSKEKKDYGHSRKLNSTEGETFSSWAIIAGKNLNNIAIYGRGTIDGQGSNFKYKNGPRPKNIYLENCSDVLIEGIYMRSAGSWLQHYRRCDRLTIRDIIVFNHVSYNNDGLNIDSCKDVIITGCRIDSNDDAIVLKSLTLNPCENITISDCIVSSHCNSIKMGTESGGGFQNINVSNCTICSPRYSKFINGRQRGLAGIALEIVDGGTLDRVAISNLTIKGVTVPIFMRLGNRARLYEKGQSKPDIGKFRNVIISNIIATDCSPIGCSIILEKPKSYPESVMFGTLPAYGFFCRHVKGLKFKNIRLETLSEDYRHAIVFDDVDEAVIDSLDAPFASGAVGMIRCTNSRNIFIRNCRPPNPTDFFLYLDGSRTKNILLLSNDLSGVKEIANSSDDVSESVLVLKANQLPKE